MIRIRIYSNDPRWESLGIGKFEGGEPAKIDEDSFDKLFRNNGVPPLRDEVSIRLLRTFGRWEFMEEEWYGLRHHNGWDSLSFPELSTCDRFTRAALCLTANSRKGIYTDYSDDAWYWFYDKKEPADLLNRLPFDILAACNVEDLKDFVYGFRLYDGLIENWPFHGKTLQVHVRLGIWGRDNPFFQKIPAEKTALRLGKDGLYYVDPFHLKYSDDFINFREEWHEDRENTIREAEKLRKPKIRLIETASESTAEDYLNRLCGAVRKYSDRIPASDRHDSLWNCSEKKEPDTDDLPKERRNFQIISRLSEIPYLRSVYKYAHILRIRKRKDKSPECFTKTCVKFPDFLDLMHEAFDMIAEEGEELEEYLMVVFDVEEGSVKNIVRHLDRAACGFLLHRDNMEILDGYQAVQRLAADLRKIGDLESKAE